jgi:hypothetical protein
MYNFKFLKYPENKPKQVGGTILCIIEKDGNVIERFEYCDLHGNFDLEKGEKLFAFSDETFSKLKI